MKQAPAPRISCRSQKLSPPFIEDVLDQYKHLPDTFNLALGVSHWGPPPSAIRTFQAMGQGVEGEKYPESRGIGTQKEAVEDVGKQESRSLHGYGPIAGNADLLAALTRKLETENRLDLTGQDILVTGGANQAFALLALALCDPGDRAVLFAPYYFSHLVALQIAQAEVVKGRWDPATWLPDVEHLRSLLAASPVKMVILTTPGNPTGAVCPESLLKEVAALCRKAGAWLVVDESYEHFLHEGARHVSLCASALDFSGLIHVYSFSKSYGMAGWRLGYLVYPRGLKTALRSLQDTIPTHAAMISQAVGLAALEAGRKWVQRQVAGLTDCRERLWAVLSKHCPGSVRTEGAFYFLAQLPPHVSEAEAVHRLATEYRVLCTPGEAFGAPGTLRLSYGSLSPAECMDALGRLDAGLAALIKEGTDNVSKK